MSVAGVYAKVLFESLPLSTPPGAIPGAIKDQVESELKTFDQALRENKNLSAVLTGPLATHQEKVALIAEISKRGQFGSLSQRFLTLLANKNRLSSLGDILNAFRTVCLQASGGIMGKLVTAEP